MLQCDKCGKELLEGDRVYAELIGTVQEGAFEVIEELPVFNVRCVDCREDPDLEFVILEDMEDFHG